MVGSIDFGPELPTVSVPFVMLGSTRRRLLTNRSTADRPALQVPAARSPTAINVVVRIQPAAAPTGALKSVPGNNPPREGND